MKTSSKLFDMPNPAMKLLVFFLERPTQEFYESVIRKKTKMSAGAANKYLKLLHSKGILLLKKEGRMNFYSLKRDNGLVKQLKVTHSISLPIANDLKKIGKTFGIKIYLYGSVARGEDLEDSDWDILIIGNIRLHDLEKEIRHIRKKFNKKLNLSLFTKAEWARMSKKDPAFYGRVEKDRIELV